MIPHSEEECFHCWRCTWVSEMPSTQLLIFLTKLQLTSNQKGTGTQPTGRRPKVPWHRSFNQLKVNLDRPQPLLLDWTAVLVLKKMNYLQLKDMSNNPLLRWPDLMVKSVSRTLLLLPNKLRLTKDKKRIRTLSTPVTPLSVCWPVSVKNPARLFKYNRLI